MKKSVKSFIRYTVLIVAILLLTPSCTLAKLSKVGRQIEVTKVESVEIKGMTGLSLEVEVRNDSQHDLSMRDASVTLKLDGAQVAILKQIGEVSSPAESVELISSMWRVESVEAMNLFVLASKIAKRDLSGMSIDFSAELSVMNHSRVVSGKDVDISNLMGDFAF